ncbi:MAG TPA: hypothetical protein VHS81_05080 [Caulobacteraceae bacterium]|jgi:hypothetical protein|nr:hypothetical protein [Caulobacteraceae bacterium]
MLRLLTRVQLAYVGVFFACCIGVFVYEARYVWPVQACEKHGGWWSDRYRQCATPVPIWQITGRVPQGWAPIAGRPEAIHAPATPAAKAPATAP